MLWWKGRGNEWWVGVERPLVGFLDFGTRRELFLLCLFGTRVGVSALRFLMLLGPVSIESLPLVRSLVREVVLLGRLTPEGDGEWEWLGTAFLDGGVPSTDLTIFFLFLVFFFTCCCSSCAFLSACLVRTREKRCTMSSEWLNNSHLVSISSSSNNRDTTSFGLRASDLKSPPDMTMF